MKKLYLVRHAKAERISNERDDFSRKLIKKGKLQAEQTGTKLKQLNTKPDLIITSAASRALETAQIMSKKLGYPFEDLVTHPGLYSSSYIDLLKVISEIPDTFMSVMIVGHNPTLFDLMHNVSESREDGFAKAAACLIELNIDNWSDISKQKGKLIFMEQP